MKELHLFDKSLHANVMLFFQICQIPHCLTLKWRLPTRQTSPKESSQVSPVHVRNVKGLDVFVIAYPKTFVLNISA